MNAVVRAPLSGEILGPADVITVTAAVHPLKPNAELLILPAGLSVTEIIREVGKRCRVSRLASGAEVSISGHLIHERFWPNVRVKPGAHVMVRARAGKGVGNIVKSILMIGLAVLAPWAGGLIATAGWGLGLAAGTFGAQLATAAISGAIMIGGGLLLNALFPPTQTKSITDTPSYSISAGKNGVSKWGPIPFVLGQVRAMPKYAALPYTEFEGDDQYLRLLFVWGYGPIKIEDIRIGDTSIDEFDDVEIETFEGYGDDGQQTLYPDEVVQDDISVDPGYNDPVVRTSASDTNEIVLDFVAPAGLGRFDDKGKLDSRTIFFQIEMSPAGADTWTNKGTVSLAGKASKPIRRSFRYVVTKGEYDIRVTRQTGNSDSSKVLDDVTWTAIKSFRIGNPPISFNKPLAITAMRIRATRQLNGVVDTLNGLVTSVGKSWDGTSWVDAQQTRNPADLMRMVLQSPANARAVSDSRLDLSTFEAFAEHCTAKGFTFDMYRDYTASVQTTLFDIAASARAAPVFKDGKWSVVWEDDTAPIMQQFTPRNSRDFRWTQTYKTLPHALRCKFVNAAKDFIEDELLAFDEGYTKDNATLYEQAEFPGITSAELVYKQALYRIADAKERPAVYTMTVDFEHLVSQRGDRVAVQHDVIRQGLCSGRVKAVAGQQITLDEPAVMEAGKFYGIRFRLADGTSVVRNVTTVAGEQSVVTITGTAPAVGDLYSFGIRDQETGIYRILRIRPGDDLTAEIDLVDDGENVQTGDSETEIPSGTVTPTPQTSSFTPFGLKSESFVQPGQTGNVYVVRIYWQAVLGPEYTSFEIVGTSNTGQIRKVVAGDERSVDFSDVQSDTWSFTVRGLMADGKYTLASSPLVVPVDVPYDDLGISLGDHQADVSARLREMEARLEETSARLELIAAGAAEATGSNIDLHTVAKRFQNATAVALREMTASIEVKTTVYRQATAPVGDLSDGDIWINTADGNAVKVWNATTSTWDDAGAKGLKTFAQSAPPTAENVGDLWVDTDDDNKLYRWDGSDWIEVSDSRIEAQATILDAVQAAVGEVSADGLRKIEVTAGTGDVVARLTDMVRATIADDWVQAGRVTEVGFTGGDPGQPFSRTYEYADQFIFTDGTATAVPVVFEDGVAYLDEVRVRQLIADELEVIGKFNAGLVLQDGTVITDLIGFNAITESIPDELPQTTIPGLGTTWQNVQTTTIPARDAATPIDLSFVLSVTATSGGSNTNSNSDARIIRRDSGGDTEIPGSFTSVTKAGSGTAGASSGPSRILDNAPAEAFQYIVQARNYRSGVTAVTSGTVTAQGLLFMWWKR